MAYSTQRATSDGTLLVLPLAIQFFDKVDIRVFVDEVPQIVDVDYEWLTSTSIRFLSGGVPTPVPVGQEVLLRRETDKEAPRHIFTTGSPFTYESLDEDFRQILYIAQEAIEGSNVGDIYTTLNMHGNRILNVGVAVEDGDAVSLGQYRADALGANQAKVLAQQARDRAILAETNANAARDRAITAETRAIVEADRSKSEADRSQAAADTTGANVTLAQTARAGAEAARDAAIAARTGAEAAATSADSDADRAEAARLDMESKGLQLGMSMWGYRPQPFQGFALDDGQELDRALYPDFVAGLDAGLFPTVTEAQWQADPTLRGCFVANSSSGKFRMRDLNGAQPGSIGGVFQRGGTAGDGTLRMDQIQNIKGSWALGTATGHVANGQPGPTGAFKLGDLRTNAFGTQAAQSYTVEFDASGSVRTGVETAPKQVLGAWMTRLFGIITPLGSAEANSLATAYASMASRVGVLEAGIARLRMSYDSGPLPVAVGFTSVNHGLGAAPKRYQVLLECVTATSGYAVGDVVELPANNLYVNGSTPVGHTALANATSISIYIHPNGSAIFNRANGTTTSIVRSEFRLRLRASLD